MIEGNPKKSAPSDIYPRVETTCEEAEVCKLAIAARCSDIQSISRDEPGHYVGYMGHALGYFVFVARWSNYKLREENGWFGVKASSRDLIASYLNHFRASNGNRKEFLQKVGVL